MFKLLRVLVTASVLGAVVWVAIAVPLGKHTLWGHAQRIWATDEAQDLVAGAEESAGPAVERMKRGVEAGVREAQRAASPDAAPLRPAPPPRP